MKARALFLTLGCLIGCAFACMAQTLTSTIQFTGTGFIGTPANTTVPFQGQNFSNATITVTQIANTANRQSCCTSGYYILNDSASVSIAGIGTYQVTAPTCTFSDPHIDPIKAVTSVEIGFWTCIGDYPIIAIADFLYPASSPWNLLSSYGPIQLNGNNLIEIETINGGLPTSGGTLMFNPSGSPISASSGSFQATFNGTPSAPTLTRTGVLSHIAAGGGWTTVITLVSNSSTALPVTVTLHNEGGGALSLPVTTTLQGLSQTTTTSSMNATINPKATLLISTGDGIASTAVGWADVLSSGTLGGFAIFRQTPQNGSPSEGTVPLQSQYPTTMTLPYDDSAGFVMGVALANLSTTTANVTATVWDDAGNQIGIQNITIAGSGHTSFVLPTQIPVTAGKRGIVQFQSPGGLAGLGLRFSPFGTFTSVPTI